MKQLFFAMGLTAVCLMLQTPVFAAENNVQLSGRCDVNLKGDFSFYRGELLVFDKNNEEILINKNRELYVKGAKVDLNATQQGWIDQYYEAIEQTIPQVITVAKEGVKIANYAVTEVLVGLLGADSKTVQTLNEQLRRIETGLDQHINQDSNYISFDTRTLEQDIGVSRDWESQYERLLEDVMPTAMGEFFVALGRSMMSEGSSGESFEQRMEKMGEAIEQNVSAQTDKIEKDADRLCEYFEKIEKAEQDIQKIPQLERVDLLKVHQRA